MKLTEYLAIYAAALSTGVFFWNVFRALPRFKVDIAFAVHKERDEYLHGIYIAVRNPSSHPIHIAGVDLLCPIADPSFKDKVRHTFTTKRMPTSLGWLYLNLSNYGINDGCPFKLEPGTSKNIFVPNEAIEKMLTNSASRSIMACVQDQLWRNKYSNSFEYSEEYNDENSST